MPQWLLTLLGGPIVQKLLDLIPDPNERARQQFALQQAAMEEAAKAESEQRQINQAEASNASVFVAGWRPFIGWVCGLALVYQYLAVPLVTWGAAVAAHPLPPMPGLDDNLWQLLMGMLGLGGLRTFEKVRGVTK